MTRLVWQLVGTLLVVGLVLKYWWLIVLVVGVVVVCKQGPRAWQRHQAAVTLERERLAQVAERADRQHSWRMAGDDRGVYGVAWPDVQKYEREVKR